MADRSCNVSGSCHSGSDKRPWLECTRWYCTASRLAALALLQSEVAANALNVCEHLAWFATDCDNATGNRNGDLRGCHGESSTGLTETDQVTIPANASTHGPPAFLLHVTLAGDGKLRIHQSPPGCLQIDVVQAWTTLSQSKYEQNDQS